MAGLAVVLVIGAKPLSQSASRGFLELSGMGTGALAGSGEGSADGSTSAPGLPGSPGDPIAAARHDVVQRAARLVAFAAALASVEADRDRTAGEGSR